MAYSVETISSSAIPTAPQTMKEERVVETSGVNTRLIKAQERVAAAQSGQPANIETNEAVETKPAAESVTLAPHMAALARKEQKFRKEQQALKAGQAKLEAEKAEVAELKALKEKLDAGDYSAIESKVPYDKYTNYLIEKDKGTNPDQIALKKLADEVTGLKKATEENVSKQFEAAVNERRQAVIKAVDTDPQFARIKKAKAQEAVVQHILDTWEHDSQELSIEDALKEVNKELEARAKQWAALIEEQPAQPDGEKKPLPPMKPGLKTLTNQMTTGDIKRAVKPLWSMPEGERYAEARRRAEEKLKQGR